MIKILLLKDKMDTIKKNYNNFPVTELFFKDSLVIFEKIKDIIKVYSFCKIYKIKKKNKLNKSEIIKQQKFFKNFSNINDIFVNVLNNKYLNEIISDITNNSKYFVYSSIYNLPVHSKYYNTILEQFSEKKFLIFDCLKLLTFLDIKKIIKLQSTTKFKGFQGIMKRFGYGGGPASHGVSLTHRRIGGISTHGLGRILINSPMPGNMGKKSNTIFNNKIFFDNNKILVKGSISGYRFNLVNLTI